MASSWFLFFSYHNDAGSNKHLRQWHLRLTVTVVTAKSIALKHVTRYSKKHHHQSQLQAVKLRFLTAGNWISYHAVPRSSFVDKVTLANVLFRGLLYSAFSCHSTYASYWYSTIKAVLSINWDWLNKLYIKGNERRDEILRRVCATIAAGEKE